MTASDGSMAGGVTGGLTTIAVLTDMWPTQEDPGAGAFVAAQTRALADRYRGLVLVPRLALGSLHRRVWGQAVPGQQRAWLEPPPPHRLLRYPMVRIPRGSEVGPRVVGAVTSLRRARERPALVHAHFLHSVAPLGVALARRLGTPSVVTAHGTDARWLVHGGIQDRFRREMLDACRHADKVIAVSHVMARELEALGVDANRLAVVSMGVDEGRFQIGDRFAARQELGLAANRPLVGFVGHATEAKGFEVLAEALGQLDGVACFAAGSGPLESPRIERLGALDPERLALWITAADVICLPSFAEGMPVSIMEALACGRPVVATAVGGMTEQVIPGANGLLVEAGDSDALARAISRALTSRWSAEAIRLSSERFWWSRLGPRLASIYEALLGKA